MNRQLSTRSARLPLAVGFYLLLARNVHAQDIFDEAFNKSNESGFSLNWNSWQIEVALLLLALVVACFFSFLVIFPALLQKSRPTWPLTAYGISWFFVGTVTFVAALWLFWDKLTFDDGGSVSFLGLHGLRLGLGVVWLIVSALLLSVFRSNHGRTAAT